MNADQIKSLTDLNKSLTVGMPVLVRWGYGLGFRAKGKGKIAAIYAKSVRVELTEDVYHDNKLGWHAGFVLKGIPRFSLWGDNRWDYWNSVTPIEEAS